MASFLLMYVYDPQNNEERNGDYPGMRESGRGIIPSSRKENPFEEFGKIMMTDPDRVSNGTYIKVLSAEEIHYSDYGGDLDDLYFGFSYTPSSKEIYIQLDTNGEISVNCTVKISGCVSKYYDYSYEISDSENTSAHCGLFKAKTLFETEYFTCSEYKTAAEENTVGKNEMKLACLYTKYAVRGFDAFLKYSGCNCTAKDFGF